MTCKIEKFGSYSAYYDSFFRMEEELKELPFFIKNRPDLDKKIADLEKDNVDMSLIFKSDYGIIISDVALPYQESSFFCDKWVTTEELLNLRFTHKTVVVIGLYRDFTQAKVLELINYCYANSTEVYFLIGRDFSSLTWMIGKQFIKNSFNWNKKGIFSLLNLSQFSSDEYEFFDNKDLEKKDIKNILESNEWEQLIFHGHGKEDHLNLDDYTLTGMNNNLNPEIPFAPSIGHEGHSFFKDASKAILVDEIKVKQIFFLSLL